MLFIGLRWQHNEGGSSITMYHHDFCRLKHSRLLLWLELKLEPIQNLNIRLGIQNKLHLVKIPSQIFSIPSKVEWVNSVAISKKSPIFSHFTSKMWKQWSTAFEMVMLLNSFYFTKIKVQTLLEGHKKLKNLIYDTIFFLI